MDILNHKYTIEEGPSSMEWEKYVKVSEKEYKKLLSSESTLENDFHTFFEKNPSFLPGAFGVLGGSGHLPLNNALITKPRLTGNEEYIPDFLWIATDSCTVYPVFIEIETPQKKWFRNDGTQHSAFTQARSQLLNWKTWYSDPSNELIFRGKFGLHTHLSSKQIKPQYVLIYGSRDEFEGKDHLNRKRSGLEGNDEYFMTFDRLKPNRKARNAITCTIDNHNQLQGKFMSPTFQYEPCQVDNLVEIDNLENVIESSIMDKERQKFLLDRLKYWVEFGRNPKGNLSLFDSE